MPPAFSRWPNRPTTPELFWVDPERRGILPLDGFHLPRRLRRTVRAGRFEVSCDRDFAAVMRGCAEPTATRPQDLDQRGDRRGLSALYRRGHAHSVEAWLDGELVGGLYGVTLGGAFFGESMFSRVTDASKVALAIWWRGCGTAASRCSTRNS